MRNYVFTSESITSGHPDKICDYISDSILDEALKTDPNAHMAVEVTIKDEVIFIYGECNTFAELFFEDIARKCMQEIGYHENYNVIVKVGKQSPEINNAVVKGDSIAAGDQGIMFGYACDETPVFMPAPIYYANCLAQQLDKVRQLVPQLKPDGKTQVTVEYENNRVKRIDTIVISIQHEDGLTIETIKQIIMDSVINMVIPNDLLDKDTKYLINPSGSFIVGGSFGDSGTTGRKIICDSYGGMGRIGGGCFSSKDPSKVDRSAAYYCRYVAKNVVANGLAKKCEIQLAYAIGQSEPISINLDTFQTGVLTDEDILAIVKNNFSFTVSNMIEELDLQRPIYKETSVYGHFGRNQFPWENVIKLKKGIIWKK